ncbi:MAG: queuosine precursor transporter [Candidatus Peregrinibacteria bacterium]
MRPYRFFDLIMAAFVAVVLISNVASSAKIVDFGISLFGTCLAFDGGTLLFPLSYIFGDILTEVYGYARSRRVIWAGFAAALLMSACIALVQWMPGEEAWRGYAGDQAFGRILGGVSSGGIVLASVLAYLLGEFSNSFILAKMKVWMEGHFLWMRTIGSTVVGEGVDTIVFILLATLFGVFPWEIVGSLILTNYLFKVGIEILFTPVTYRVVSFLKTHEHEDHYDRTTDFNPFRLSSAA